MTCRKAESIIEKKTGDGALPISIRLHLLRCPSCAAEAKRMETAITAMRRDFLPAAPDFSTAVMNAIRRVPALAPAPVSFRNWLIVGATLLAAIGLSPFGDAFGWVKTAFGTGFLLPISLVFGLALATYCALFIGTHLDEFSRRLKLKHD